VRQTLFFIPHEVMGIQLFGLGWLLVIWILFSIAWLTWLIRRHGWNADTMGLIPFVVVVAVAIAFVIPRFEVSRADGVLLGLPIRGYGTFVLAGFSAGLGLAVHRAGKRGIIPETIFSLAVWMFVAAFIGARLFFVIEYWESFRRDTWLATFAEVGRIAEGGLVVYGALLAGLPALYLFCRKHQISPLVLGDVVAPCLALGLALGRLGCLMNGCCYGGICEPGPLAIQFPKYNSVVQKSMSPPYVHQLTSGRLHGFVLGTLESGEPVVQSVVPGGPAEKAGLKSGDRINAINGEPAPNEDAARKILAKSGPTLAIETSMGTRLQWTIGALPTRSLAVHPIQIYSAVNAMLLCLILVFGEPFMRRTGEVLAWTLTLYPPLRFLEEIIRVDEIGQFGTNLSISQLISLGVLAAAACLWFFILRNEPAKSYVEPDRTERLSVA
jgi:phosphatidylglycerol:prolipoprotein diacylglycerol transferase